MRPTLICMFKVGECGNLLSQAHMETVAEATMYAWMDTATEHVNLKAMYVAEASGIAT